MRANYKVLHYAYPFVHIIAREEVLLSSHMHYRAAQLLHCRTQYECTKSSWYVKFELLALVKVLAAFSNYDCARAIELLFKSRTTTCDSICYKAMCIAASTNSTTANDTNQYIRPTACSTKSAYLEQQSRCQSSGISTPGL
eukprot:5622-Heterococcus_DN1.PRE.2